MLEVWLGQAFEALPYPDFQGFWCDGVVMDQAESYYSQKYINDKREVQFKTWAGESGQTPYALILKFGPKALSRYARGLDIRICMPDEGSGVEIDPEHKRIVVQLY